MVTAAFPFQNQSSNKQRSAEAEKNQEKPERRNASFAQGYIERGERDEERPDLPHGVLNALGDAPCSRLADHDSKDGLEADLLGAETLHDGAE